MSDTREAAIVLKNDERQIAYGVVLEPRTAEDPDTQGDWYTADDITDAAHLFVAKMALGQRTAGADLLHDERPAGVVVESWVAQTDTTLGGQVIKAGSWIAGIHYPDPTIWERVKKGELAAFSVGGVGTRIS